MKNKWRLVSALVIALVVIIFAILNVEPVRINFGITAVHWPLILVIVVTLILGVITAVLMATVNESKERTAHSEALAAAQAKIDKLTAENKQLTLRLNNKGKQKRAVAEQPTTPADK